MAERFNGDYSFGVMSSAYPFLDGDAVLEEVAKIGGGGLVQEVELCALDPNGARMRDPNDHVAAHLDTNAFRADAYETAKKFAASVNRRGLGVTLGNYEFIHTNNPRADGEVLDFTMRLIDFAAALGGKDGGVHGVNVGMFWGMDRTKGHEENVYAVAKKLTVLGHYAKDRNVIITSENCHMPGGGSPPNDMHLPPAVNRALGSTHFARRAVQHLLKEAGLEGVLEFTWDASHPETQHGDPLLEARMNFACGDVSQYHVKGHDINAPGEAERRAWYAGPALPGWFADPDSKLYKLAKEIGAPIGDNAWAQQYGAVTLAGDGASVTPYGEIIEIARASGFKGRVTAENETERKGRLVAAQDVAGLSQMFADCNAAIREHIWDGDNFQGEPFVPLDVDGTGMFEPMLTFTEAARHYKIQL